MHNTLKQLINYTDRRPISADDLYKAVNGDVNIVEHIDLDPSGNIYDLFGTANRPCVIYYAFKGSDIGHFVTMTYDINRNTIEYFDPIGMPPDYYTQSKAISNMFNNCGSKIVTNSTRLQKANGIDDACGRYAIVRCWYQHVPLEEFVSLINKRVLLNNASDIVVLMTLGII